MDEEGSPPSTPGPRRFPPFSPEERLPDEIDQLLALRQTWAKTNVPTSRRNWEEVTRPLGRARRRGWTRRLDANIVALAILSVIGCALLVFVFMNGGGDQIPRGPYFAFVAPHSSQSPHISVIQPTTTQAIQATQATQATQAIRRLRIRGQRIRLSRVRPRLHHPPRSQRQRGRRSQPLLLLHDPPRRPHHSRRRRRLHGLPRLPYLQRQHQRQSLN